MKTYIRSIRAIDGDTLLFNSKVPPFEAKNASGGLLRVGDWCLVQKERGHAITSVTHGNPEVLEIKDEVA